MNLNDLFNGLFGPTSLLGQILAILLSLLGIFGTSGCTIALLGDGEIGFKMNNEFAFYHQAPETNGGSKAEANLLEPAWDLVNKAVDKANEPETQSEPQADTTAPATQPAQPPR